MDNRNKGLRSHNPKREVIALDGNKSGPQTSDHGLNPNIVMDDHSSIYRAFEPDRTVYCRHDQSRPYIGEVVPVTLTPGSYSDFEAACKASQ